MSSSNGHRRPNILFIMTDDHAAHAMSCYGSVVNRRPTSTASPRQGMRFDNCFCTNSICTPSRAVDPHRHLQPRQRRHHAVDAFDGRQPTFPTLLQAPATRRP